MNHTVTERFLRYVQIDTQADPESSSTPSTEKQKNLSKVLAQELKDMGLTDVELTEHGYVYATVPSNSEKQNVPVICFCAHVDTAPDCSGTNVKPILHKNWDGKDIVLPDDTSVVIRPADHADLAAQVGNDIITASGLTLLGSDDKSGVAEIMDAAYQLVNNPTIKHGKVRLLFTTDEEVGRGVDNVDMAKLGAKYGYTLDGGPLGELEDETFSADAVKIVFHGVSTHPGYAKGKMENAMKIAGDLLARLPKDTLCPEATSGRQGFVHPVRIEGLLETATLQFIIRDHDDDKLPQHEAFLKNLLDEVMKSYPNSTYEWTVVEQYRNMKKVLDLHPEVVANAVEAIKRAGLTPKIEPIRGGTDGSRLSFMGLPCPNIFAGEHNIHGKKEWTSRQDMEKAVETIVHLCQIWEEKA